MTRSRRTPAILAAFGAVLVLLGFVAPSATAQTDDSERLVLRSVDATDPDNVVVDFFYSGSRAAVADAVVREDGAIVENSSPIDIVDEDPFGIVLVIDTSASMADDGAFEQAVGAVSSFIADKDPDDEVAVVSFNADVQVIQGFTDDIDEALESLDALGVGTGSSLYDGVRTATNLYEERPDLVPNLVVLSAGEDSGSETGLDATVGLLDEDGTFVFGVGLVGADTEALERLAEPTGGVVIEDVAVTDLEDVYADVQDLLRQQYRTTFASAVDGGQSVPLSLFVGGARAETVFTPTAQQDRAISLAPVEPAGGGGVEFLQGRWVLYLAVVLVLLAVAGGVFSLVTGVVRDGPGLDGRLQPYADGFAAPNADDEGSFVSNPLLQRAVQATGDFADRQGFLEKAEGALERANLPLRGAESLFFSLVFVIAVAVVALVLTGNAMIALLAALFALLVPPAIVSYLAGRRRRQFTEQLPDMLQLLSSTLRAGYSLMQGMEAASQEVAEPMRRELGRVVSESRLGLPLEDALQNVADRMDSDDFAWAVMAIRIQREVGGNLAELLMTVAETMTQRERLRRDVKALTAEGRVSAIVLGILPLAIGAVITTLNPDYTAALFERTAGNIMLGFGLVLMGVGFFWMYKTIDIEI